MRVRTEEKRSEIVEIAAQLFEEQGYDRTSMSQISERVGGSKATLYGYFRSKEEILYAVLDYDVTQQADQLMQELLTRKTLREGLVTLGVAYMERLLSRRPISNVRMVANQPPDSDIGKLFYENVLKPAWQRLAARFQLMMDEGALKRADPWVAAMQWKGLCEWDMFERRLLGAIPAGDPKEIRRAATLAADVFLQVYGTSDGAVPLAGTRVAGPIRRPPARKPGAKSPAKKAAAKASRKPAPKKSSAKATTTKASPKSQAKKTAPPRRGRKIG